MVSPTKICLLKRCWETKVDFISHKFIKMEIFSSYVKFQKESFQSDVFSIYLRKLAKIGELPSPYHTKPYSKFHSLIELQLIVLSKCSSWVNWRALTPPQTEILNWDLDSCLWRVNKHGSAFRHYLSWDRVISGNSELCFKCGKELARSWGSL